MNKKGNIYKVLYTLILLTLLFGGVYFSGNMAKQEWDKYTAYREFCEERPSFCHCSWFECEYKIRTTQSSTIINGKLTDFGSEVSKEVKDLCNLGKQLNDTKMLFKAGCLE
jgi:hypothetical protein